MDSERFDGLVRRVGQARSRRQTLRGLVGAGALVALLAATSGEDVTAGELPHEHLQDRTPQRNRKQRNQRQNNNNQNTSNTNGGGLGAGRPPEDCQEQCEEQCQEPCEEQCSQKFESCVFGCGDDPDGTCLDGCESDQVTCGSEGQCNEQCEEQCFQACYRG